jgi:hypothetical protein
MLPAAWNGEKSVADVGDALAAAMNDALAKE